MKTAASLALALLATPGLAVQAPHETSGSLELGWQATYASQVSTGEAALGGTLRSGDLYTVGRTRDSNSSSSRWLVLLHDLGTGTETWRVLYPGAKAHGQEAVDADLSDDGATLFVAGKLSSAPGWGSDLGMIALDAGTGSLLWEQTYSPDYGQGPRAQAASGSAVYVTGYRTADLLMLARSQSDGSLLWAETFDGGGQYDIGYDLAVAEEGGVTRVFATGRSEVGSNGGGVVVARAATDGSLLWTRPEPQALYATELRAVDAGTGLVVAAGDLGPTPDVRAYAPLDGTPLWSASFDDTAPWLGGAVDVAIDWTGTRVLVTGTTSTASGDGDLRTLCLDATTGAVLWQQDWGAAPGTEERGVALALCPCVNSVHVTGTTETPGQAVAQVTVGYDIVTGALKWAQVDQGLLDHQPAAAFAGSAKVAVVGELDSLQGVGDLGITTRAAPSGILAWSVQLDLLAEATDMLADLAWDGSRLLGAASSCCAEDARVLAWDGTDGRLLWEVTPALAGDREARRVAGGPLTYLAGRADDGNFLQAIDAATGTPLWLSLFPGVPWATTVGLDLEQAASSGLAFTTTTTGTDDFSTHDWTTQAWDPVTGANLWTTVRDPLGYEDAPADLGLSPDGLRVFVTGITSPATYLDLFGLTWSEYALGTVAYDALTGTELWARDWQGSPGVPVDAGVALAADATRVFVTGYTDGGDERAFVTLAYDAATGTELWSSLFEGSPLSMDQPTDLAVGAGRVYVGGWSRPAFGAEPDLAVVAYDVDTGLELWRDLVTTPTDDAVVELDLDPTGTRLRVVASRRDPFVGSAVMDALTLVLDAASGARLGEALHGGTGSPGTDELPVALAADGRRLFVGGHDSDGTTLGLDVQLSAYDVPYLVGEPDELSVATGGTHVLSVETDVTQAGRPFLLLGSLAAADPGIAVDGVHLPLVSDAYLMYTLTHPNPPWFAGSFSLLDARGRGAAHLIVQPSWVAGLAGLVVHHAYLVFELPGSGQAILASEAVSLTLTP